MIHPLIHQEIASQQRRADLKESERLHQSRVSGREVPAQVRRFRLKRRQS